MELAARINALLSLGQLLSQPDEFRSAVISRTSFHNPWFTVENQERALASVVNNFLQPDILMPWVASYELPEPTQPKRLGLVMAGNIPLVGFHDFMCIFLSGHHALIKLSDKDPYLWPHLLDLLKRIDPRSSNYFSVVERLSDMDAVIATGSNNTSRYFEAYFGKYPHIIRRNRNGVGVFTGHETPEELMAFGKDVFRYFGLGCRNVSKIYVPQGYVFDPLLEAMHEYRQIILHNKYKNNFDYYYAWYLLNRVTMLGNGCLILVENQAIPSHVAGLHFEYYPSIPELETALTAQAAEIQVIVASPGVLTQNPSVPFGQAQEPTIADYADGVDTLLFLKHL